MAHDLARPVTVRWCEDVFGQLDENDDLRAYDCTRERGHEGLHDSILAQERRRSYQTVRIPNPFRSV